MTARSFLSIVRGHRPRLQNAGVDFLDDVVAGMR
jgi:hypothetical protein